MSLGVLFQSTIWSVIELAKAGDRSMLNELIGRYRPAVVGFLVRQGMQEDRAEDVAQEVFLTLYDQDVLGRLHRRGGKFRSFLIAVTKNVLGNLIKRERAAKRGGDRPIVSLDGVDVALAGEDAQDDTFDHVWVLNLLKLGMERLRRESERRDTPYAEAMRLISQEQCSYAEAADRMGRSEGDIRNYVHRGRELLAEYVREVIAQYAFDLADYECEVSAIERILQRVKHEGR